MGVNVIVRCLERGHVTHPNTSREPLHTRHENTYPYDNLTLTIRHYWKAAVPTVPRPWPVRSFLLLSRARPTVGSCVFVRWRLRYTALEWTFSCRHYWSQCGVGCKTSRSTNVCKYLGGYRYVPIRITYSYGYKEVAKVASFFTIPTADTPYLWRHIMVCILWVWKVYLCYYRCMCAADSHLTPLYWRSFESRWNDHTHTMTLSGSND